MQTLLAVPVGISRVELRWRQWTTRGSGILKDNVPRCTMLFLQSWLEPEAPRNDHCAFPTLPLDATKQVYSSGVVELDSSDEMR